ncbi:alpha-1,3-mannosyl-glycoprotein 4-beta-N-acetylglucosaminyltransferase-like protein MGAT4E [Cricetulus griseus]|uniref:Alpha-1,3-mannosyl-glycoprotein 4-beta-N-acetylglucosaminyltransferase-like protein MGAT4E n=1 Tax=Cricetulus griseus TaxID=10029 RepID=A0A9J7JJF9_CRIGR|nr:alpha-1,3-mannosyl-glycoprotein 4-beta-N-acetylglucosaminyltransferase-like protein MGAT4E [Cricetulus griseus]ERE74365.1 alpha-1,3-mannosyl-glycoprotein 4-beta-N-acetylglucosaminyltransferase C [Cricetulus griseus]
MRGCLWRFMGVMASLVILRFFIQENKAAGVKHNTTLNEKKKIIQQITQEQIISEMKNHLKYFTKMQKNPLVLPNANYTLLAGTSLQGKWMLTVGISSVQRTHGSYLLDTLKSLFQASSELDLEYMLVLVLLSDTDPKWLNQTVANISGLFLPHIESGRLAVVHGLLGDSLAKSRNGTSPCGELYSRQKTSFVLLMNFASNLSDYFLLLEDNVRCSPRFVSDIYWAVSAWKELPWVTLDFSSMKNSGKVFHSRDLSRLASFLLLFPKDIPTHLLLSEFSLLLSQNVPIHFSSSIFYPLGSHSEAEDTCFPVAQDTDLGEPDNPMATVFTDMLSFWDTLPQFAYILNDDSLWVVNPIEGNYLLVVLDKPQKVIRVAVLTGFSQKRMNYLKQAQILLGYSVMDYPKRCAQYTLVGPLVRGQLDQMVFYEEDSVKEISCIKLLVTVSHDSPIKIQQIKVWAEVEEEEN